MVLDMFVETVIFNKSLTNRKERAIETEILCKIINVFTVTFNQFTVLAK